MKSMRIIGPRRIFALSLVAIDLPVDSCKMVVDDNNAAYRLRWLVWSGANIGFAQEPSNARYFPPHQGYGYSDV